ncbi:hypothetical protein FRB94_007834 [Tulasnella sp. JGI-2019a]|nr:hypothetical protein FRB93_002543 [Tulasnella sp. JGI-2019a]KAG8997146.1 hypothetical protein FRB94_007834 [Tulasnella sp. JGI-2019a]
MAIYDRFGVGIPFDPDCTLVTSNLISPRALGIVRLILAVYTLTTLITILVFEGVVLHTIDAFCSYFTDLSYIGLCAYFWVSALHTLAFASRSQSRGPHTYPLQEWPRFFQLLHVLLNTTVYVAPFIVTVVFWVLLADHAFENRYEAWHNTSVHILNTSFAFLDILLGRFTPQWSSIPVLLVILVLYIALAYITYATQHFYTYSFLDPSKKHAYVLVYLLAMLIATLLVLALVKGLCRLRDRILGEEKRPESWAEMGNLNDPDRKEGYA